MSVLDLGGFDVILGADWMKFHNLVLFNFEKLQVTMQREGRPVTLQGITEGRGVDLQTRCENVSQLLQKQGAHFQFPLLYCIQFSTMDEEQAKPNSDSHGSLCSLNSNTIQPEKIQQLLSILSCLRNLNLYLPLDLTTTTSLYFQTLNQLV